MAKYGKQVEADITCKVESSASFGWVSFHKVYAIKEMV